MEDLPLSISEIEKYTIVEFRMPSLMDPVLLENVAASIYQLVDAQDKRRLILDFERVEYLSSQAIGIDRRDSGGSRARREPCPRYSSRE